MISNFFFLISCVTQQIHSRKKFNWLYSCSSEFRFSWEREENLRGAAAAAAAWWCNRTHKKSSLQTNPSNWMANNWTFSHCFVRLAGKKSVWKKCTTNVGPKMKKKMPTIIHEIFSYIYLSLMPTISMTYRVSLCGKCKRKNYFAPHKNTHKHTTHAERHKHRHFCSWQLSKTALCRIVDEAKK